MLQAAQVGPAIAYLFSGSGAAGLMVLSLGFSLAALLKIAQGSSTVAMITGSAMLAGVATGGTLGFHPVYLATAIGAGSLFGSWMNDSGFWIFAKMSGLTETEALRSWTPALIVLAVSGFLVTLLLAIVLPYPPLTAPPTAGTLP
jgi:H+/gluconate symporter-like permease